MLLCMFRGVQGEGDNRHQGIMGQKGVWAADQMTFPYTAMATGNQGQL